MVTVRVRVRGVTILLPYIAIYWHMLPFFLVISNLFWNAPKTSKKVEKQDPRNISKPQNPLPDHQPCMFHLKCGWQEVTPNSRDFQIEWSPNVQNTWNKIRIQTLIFVSHRMKNGPSTCLRWAKRLRAIFQEARKDLDKLHPESQRIVP